MMRKIDDTLRRVGVMVKPDGTVLHHYTDTVLFDTASRKNPGWLCGVYTYDITSEQMIEDLDFMGVTVE